MDQRPPPPADPGRQRALRLRVARAAAAALTLVALAAQAAPDRSKTHLLWHLVPVGGASADLAARIERVIRQRFAALHGDKLQDAMSMDSILTVEGNEKFMRCGGGHGCLAEFGRRAGVQFVIAGEVSLEEALVKVRLKRIDANTAAVMGTAEVQFTGAIRPAHIDELAIAMFEPARYRGSLELTCAVPGADVFLDGTKVGRTPLEGPLVNLPAGPHELEVLKSSHRPFRRRINIRLGQKLGIVALLPAEGLGRTKPETAFYQAWPFWSAVGLGFASLATAGFLHRDAAALEYNADLLRDNGAEEAASTRERSDERYLETWVLYGVGSAALLTAGIIAVVGAVQGRSASASVSLTPNGFSTTFTF